MTVQLATIRYLTEDDAYHYSVENRPLQDLENSTIVLKTAVDGLVNSQSGSGSWPAIILGFNLSQDLNKSFAYVVRTWAIKDQSQTSGQESTFSEDIVMGYHSDATGVVVQQVTSIKTQKLGASTLTKTFAGSGHNLTLTFTGYTGSTGYVIAKSERFGI